MIPQQLDLNDIKVIDALKIDNSELKDDLLDFGLCSPYSENATGQHENWIGTGAIGPGSIKLIRRLVTSYCQKCPVRNQCYIYAVKTKCYDGVFSCHPKYRKKRVVKAQYQRTLKEMFGKLDRAFNNLGDSDE